ncbi:glycerophosphodiester phosphodiesterase [Verrucomicrobiota bacterium]
MTLSELYLHPESVVVIAHRGFAGRFPENTTGAIAEGVKLGVDVIEFDLRASKDHVAVAMHDPTLDRTTDGNGDVGDHTLAELKELNASFWTGGHFDGRRLDEPACDDLSIPTCRECLDVIPPDVGVFLHVNQVDDFKMVEEVCGLYDEYELDGRACMIVNTFDDGRLIRRIDDRIDLCILEDRDDIGLEAMERRKAVGSRFLIATVAAVDEAHCRALKESGLLFGMFYSNTDADNRRFIAMGMKGIVTDYPDILIKTRRDIGRNAHDSSRYSCGPTTRSD